MFNPYFWFVHPPSTVFCSFRVIVMFLGGLMWNPLPGRCSVSVHEILHVPQIAITTGREPCLGIRPTAVSPKRLN